MEAMAGVDEAVGSDQVDLGLAAEEAGAGAEKVATVEAGAGVAEAVMDSAEVSAVAGELHRSQNHLYWWWSLSTIPWYPPFASPRLWERLHKR